MIRKALIVLLFPLFFQISGCATNHEKHYRPFEKTADSIQLYREKYTFLSESENPEIIYISEDEVYDASAQIRAKGFDLLGSSHWLGIKQSVFEESMIAQSKKIGASKVLTYSAPKGLRQSSGTINQTKTANTSIFNSNSGYSSAVTTYSVPMTFNRTYAVFDHVTLFFVRYNDNPKYGIEYRPLTEKIKKRIERNTGVVVTTIMDNSPAFFSNVLRGDVIIKINGIEVRNHKEANKIINTLNDKSSNMILTIIRKERVIDIVVKP